MFRRPLVIAAAAALLVLGVACTEDEAPADPGTTTATESAGSTGAEPGTPGTTAPATGTPASGTGASGTGGDTPTSDGGGTSGSAGEDDACEFLAPEAFDAAFVFVTNLQSGDYLESGTSIEGCSRTFESNVPWQLLDREGNVVAESFAMGGGVDGPAAFEFTVDYSVDEAQVGHLFVGGDDPSDGEGFPPVTNQIPVVLLP